MILTLHVKPGVGGQLAQFEGIHRLVLRVAVLDLQCVDYAIGGDLILVALLQLHTILDPLGSFHVGVGELQREHRLLGLRHSLVLQSFLDLYRCR